MIFLRLCCVRMYAAFCHERRYIGRMLTGRAYIWGRESRQVKSAKNLTVDRNGFTESRFSEQRTGITKKCASARFYEMPHGFVKSIPLTYERASTAAFPADLSRTDFYTRQRSGCAEWRVGIAFS